MNDIDLHIHSKYSLDGELEVQEIIDRCKKNNINILSITDHNSINANYEASNSCLGSGIDYIPGIEIDCSYNGIDLHLLGYNIDLKSNDFKELEGSVKEKVMSSFPEMIENLNSLGIQITENEVLKKAQGKLPCGELIAEVLLKNDEYHSKKILSPYMNGGKRSDMPYVNFYHDFFAQDKPAYVKINYMDFDDAIELVKSNNGIPVIAHPGMNFKGKEELVIELLNRGVEGLEVFNNYHNIKQMEYFADLLIQGSSLMTCGSDFHGKNKPLIDIGKYKKIEKYEDYLKKSVIHLNKKLPLRIQGQMYSFKSTSVAGS